jgi:hypothetical protein
MWTPNVEGSIGGRGGGREVICQEETAMWWTHFFTSSSIKLTKYDTSVVTKRGSTLRQKYIIPGDEALCEVAACTVSMTAYNL